MLQVDSTRFAHVKAPRPAPLPTPPTAARRLRTVAVTGTNGKTTTASWIAAALAATRTTPVMRTSTVGYYLGVESLGLPADYHAFVAMMGYAAAQGARDVVLELTSNALLHGYGAAFPASVAVFTNLSQDHLDKHQTMEAYLHAKSLLFTSMREDGTAVLNACDDAARLLEARLPEGVRTLTFATPSRGDKWCLPHVHAVEIRPTWYGTEALCVAQWPLPLPSFTLRTRGIGEPFVENALAALLAAYAAGVPLDAALRAIANANPPPGRFQVVAHRPNVVVDFAHTPDAIAHTIATARRLCDGKVTVVFGAGGERDPEKREPMGRAAAASDRVVLTSDNPRSEDPRAIADDVARGLGSLGDVRIELDRKKAIELAVRAAAPDDLVLICGKGHETTQVVGGTTYAFDDVQVARAAVASR